MTLFQNLADEFGQKGIQCLLVGGFAINHYGVGRQTADIDFMLAADDLDRISAILTGKGYSETNRMHSFVRFVHSDVLMWDVDFLLVDPETLEKLLAHAEPAMLDGREFLVPSKEDLIAMKLHSIKSNADRFHKDALDILELMELAGMDSRSGEFKILCERFGTGSILDKIIVLAGN